MTANIIKKDVFDKKMTKQCTKGATEPFPVEYNDTTIHSLPKFLDYIDVTVQYINSATHDKVFQIMSAIPEYCIVDDCLTKYESQLS